MKNDTGFVRFDFTAHGTVLLKGNDYWKSWSSISFNNPGGGPAFTVRIAGDKEADPVVTQAIAAARCIVEFIMNRLGHDMIDWIGKLYMQVGIDSVEVHEWTSDITEWKDDN